jgi:AraC-like DNA-binding protein
MGAPIERALEQMHLPGGLLSTPHCYVPTASLFGFIGQAARKEGIDDLGFRVAYAEGLGLLGPTLAVKVCESATLLHALQTFCRLVNGQASQFWSWIVEDQDEVRVHIHRTFEPGVLGYTQSEWIGVMGVVTIVQLFGGPHWQPSRISLGTRSPVPERAREIFGGTRFLTGQPEVYIAFPRSTVSLSRRQQTGDSRFVAPGALPSTFAGKEAESDFAGRLMQCLGPHLLDGYPRLTLAAEIAGTSTRTLQRRLAADGLSYSELIDRARFDIASRMLVETDARSIEIAQATAYSDPSHFARAFRRIAGLSPDEYRTQARQRVTQ